LDAPPVGTLKFKTKTAELYSLLTWFLFCLGLQDGENVAAKWPKWFSETFAHPLYHVLYCSLIFCSLLCWSVLKNAMFVRWEMWYGCRSLWRKQRLNVKWVRLRYVRSSHHCLTWFVWIAVVIACHRGAFPGRNTVGSFLCLFACVTVGEIGGRIGNGAVDCNAIYTTQGFLPAAETQSKLCGYVARIPVPGIGIHARRGKGVW
jgi:hypothetical protein